MSTQPPPSGSSDEPRDPRDDGRADQLPPSAPESPTPVFGAATPSAPLPGREPQSTYGAPPQASGGQVPQQPHGGPQQPPGAEQSPYGGPQQPYAGQQSPYAGQQSPYGGQQSPYGQAPTGAAAYGQAQGSPQGGNGLAIASIVVGGVGLVLSFVGFGVILAVVGLVLGIIALVKKKGARMLALIGTIVSGLGVLVGIVVGLAAVQAVNESLPTSGSIDSSDPGGSSTGDSASAENNAFGDTFAYDDGLSVTVSAPEAYTPGEYSDGADQAANVVFTVTVQNDTGANFEPFTYETATSGGVEASKIFDADIESSPTTVVPDGQSITYRIAFSVADPDQIVFQIAPSFDYDDAVFTS
jgi:hypothetical protein